MHIVQPNKKNFTLVELMVVILIMAVALGMLLPAFTSMGAGSAVDGAARMVSSQLMLARSEAIATRKRIAVVFPGGTFTSGASDTNNYKYQSFRSGVIGSGTTSPYTLDKWVTGTDWAFIPNKAVIRDISTTMPDVIKLAETSEEINEYGAGAYFRDSDKTAFTVLNDSDKVSDGTAETAKIINGQSNSNVRCVVFKANGGCTQTLYITIMEGVVEDGDIKGQNIDNIRVIRINEYTGKAEFIY